MERLEVRDIRRILWCVHGNDELRNESSGGKRIFIFSFSPGARVGVRDKGRTFLAVDQFNFPPFAVRRQSSNVVPHRAGFGR